MDWFTDKFPIGFPNWILNRFPIGFWNWFLKGFPRRFWNWFPNIFVNRFTNEFPNGFLNKLSNRFLNKFPNIFLNEFKKNWTEFWKYFSLKLIEFPKHFPEKEYFNNKKITKLLMGKKAAGPRTSHRRTTIFLV